MSRPAPRQTMPARPPPAAPAQPLPAQGRQPGLFAQMATTAAGVAVGSAVGHTIGAAMSGGEGQQMEAAPAPAPVPQTQQQSVACQFELRQFLDCSQNQSDITLCQGLNEALRECRVRYGVQM